MEPKKYGLIIPKKVKKEIISSSSLFTNENSDDEIIKPKLTYTTQRKNYIKKQTQLDIEKALKDDPNCFEYDRVYDDIQHSKNLSGPTAIKDKKPKYIDQLLRTAQTRKREYERRVERQVQKERDSERGKFEDKEAYVTEAYKKKMQMLKEEEEMERRRQLIEDQQDVTKKGDFSEFYRHILDQQTLSRVDQKDNPHKPEHSNQISKYTCKKSIPILDDTISKASNQQSKSEAIVTTKRRANNNDDSAQYDDRDDSDVCDDDTDEDDISDDDKITSSVIDHEIDIKKDDICNDEDSLVIVKNNPNVAEDMKSNKHEKRTVGESLTDARARYLARKNQTYVPVYNSK